MLRLLLLCSLAVSICRAFTFYGSLPFKSRSSRSSLLMQDSPMTVKKTLASLMIATSLFPSSAVMAADIPGAEGLKYPDEVVESQASKIDTSPTGTQIKKVPLLSKKTAETQVYSDIGRGFKLLRPFGFNEFVSVDSLFSLQRQDFIDVMILDD